MKKIFTSILVLLVAVAVFSLTSVKAEVVPEIGTNPDSTDYVRVEADSKQVIKSFNFEENADGINSQWGSQYREIAIPFSGSGSYYVETNDVGYPQANFYIAGNGSYRAPGTYYVQYEFKATAGVYGILSGVDLSWDQMKTECGVQVNAGEPQFAELGGWIADSKSTYQNATITEVGGGVYRVYYEFVLDGSEVYNNDNGHAPLIWFKTRISTLDGDHYCLYDNIEYGKVITGGKKLSYDWDVNYDSYELGTDPGNAQPFWGGSVATVNGSQALKYTVAAGTDNAQLGGLENRDGDYLYKKFIKVNDVAHVEFDCTIDNLTMANIWTLGTYTAIIYNGTNWHSEGDVANFTQTVNDNGSFHIAYDLSKAGYGLEFNFNFSSTAGGALYIDNFKVAHYVDAPLTDTFYTIDHAVDFAEIKKTNETPWGVQPVWANSGEYADDWWEGQTALKITGATNTYAWGDTVGGFEQREGYDNKFIKKAGLNYIQMDLGFENIGMLNIWTQGFYTSIQYNGTNWFSEGAVLGLKVKEIEDGYRISYYINFAEADMNTDVKINAAGDNGVVYINNIVVMHEDYAPYVANGTYNLVGTADVNLAVELKDADFVRVALNGEALLSNDSYELNEGNLKIKASVFAELNDEYVFTLITSRGERAFTVSKNDNRTEVTVTLKNEVTKVYDGTTDYDTYELVVNGITEGKEVSATGTLTLSSSEAGEVTVTVTGITLTGGDKDEYKLSSDTLTTTGTITKKEVIVTATDSQKTEGEDDPALEYTVEGLIGNDELTGSLARTEGEAVGTYEIVIGTLAASSNYEINFVKGQFVINKKEGGENPGTSTVAPTTTVDNTTTAGGNATTTAGGNTTDAPAKKGCGNSILGFAFAPIAIGACAVLLKKKKENE